MNKITLTAALTIFVAMTAPATLQAAPRWHEGPAGLAAGPLIDRDVALKNGAVMGRDPDSHVRFELRRDNPYY